MTSPAGSDNTAPTQMPGLRSRDEFLAHGVMPSHPMPDTDCSICTEPLDSDVIKLIRCSHAFHTVCALSWFQGKLKGNRSCPNCRVELYEAAPVPHALLNPIELDPPVTLGGGLRIPRNPSSSTRGTRPLESLPVSAATRVSGPSHFSRGFSFPSPSPEDSTEDSPSPLSPDYSEDSSSSPSPVSRLRYPGSFFPPASSAYSQVDARARGSDGLVDTQAGSSPNLSGQAERDSRGPFAALGTPEEVSAQLELSLFAGMVPRPVSHNTRPRTRPRPRPRASRPTVSAGTRFLVPGSTSPVPTSPLRFVPPPRPRHFEHQ